MKKLMNVDTENDNNVSMKDNRPGSKELGSDKEK